MEGKTHADIARAGADAANAGRSPEQRHKLASKAARRGWKGHKKKDPGCPCRMCSKKRLKVKDKK